jgi:hypothetical protein
MHGSIFAELQKFVTSNLGAEAWRTLIRESGVPTKIYLPIREYPDEELVALVATASRITGYPGPQAAVGLRRLHRARPPQDVPLVHPPRVAHAGRHRAHRGADPRAGARRPRGGGSPYLTATRLAPDEIMVHYISQRKLCAVAEGVAHGMAKHFGERVETSQRTCMHRGDDSCEILVRRIG